MMFLKSSLAVLVLVVGVGCVDDTDIEQVGGHVITYQLDVPAPDKPLSDETKAALTRTLESRLAALGHRAARVSFAGPGQVKVSLPGLAAEDLPTVQQVLGRTGDLQFRVLAQRGVHDELIEKALQDKPDEPAEPADAAPRTRWVRYDPQRGELPTIAVTRQRDDAPLEVLVVVDEFNVTGKFLIGATEMTDSLGNPCLGGRLSAEGGERMRQLTQANEPAANGVARHLGVLVDDELLTAPRILSAISSEFMLTGKFSQQEIAVLVATLGSGRLPVPLKADSAETQRVEPR